METARPFLYIDLQKSVSWKEDLHPRDKFGKFRAIKGGSRVVTSTGKTGVVESMTDTHYHVRGEDGKKFKVAKNNAIHADDHKKVMDAQAKTKKKSTAAKKGKVTEANNKANGHTKATALNDHSKKTKASEAPTAPKKGVAKVREDYEKLTGKKAGKMNTNDLIAQTNKAKRNANIVGDDASLNSPSKLQTKEIAIPSAGKKAVEPSEDKQNQALKDFDNMEADRDTTKDIDNLWNSSEVKKLMKKAPEKRSEADIRKLAGMITTANDKLARHATLQMGKARGLNLLHQVNRIGDVGESGNGEVINQETGYYGDLLQAARATMYETLYSVMKGSQNPKEGTSIAAHVINRMKDKLHNDIYNIMNDIPAPHAIRGAIGDMAKAEKELQQKLGKNPSAEELAQHMEDNYSSFKNAPIMEAPNYDEKTGQWVANKNRIKDPTERLRMLKTYAEQQRTVSSDKNIGDEGEKEIYATDNVRDDELTPDEAYEKKERQEELKDAIPKALDELGLTDKEKLVFMHMFGSPSAKTKKGNMTQDEVAEAINASGGYEGVDAKGNKTTGNQATQTWVNKYYRSALQKLAQARANSHPVFDKLRDQFFKSFFFDMILKALYEFDLVKSLNDWGISVEDMTTEYTRTASAPSLYSLRKSLAPYEYIGSVVTTEDGGIHARVIEFVLPEDNALYKSFNASNQQLKKSMFPHKGKSNHDVNQKAAEYVKANKAKYTSLADSQLSAAKAKKGGLTWSEELLIKNPGSAWITWGGKRVLMNVGDGSIVYDSANEAHREEHNQGAQEDKLEFHHEKEALEKEGLEDTEENKAKIDHGIQAFKEQMQSMRDDWKGKVQPELKAKTKHKVVRGYNTLSEEQRAALDSASDDEKAAILGKGIVDAKRSEIEDILSRYNERFKGIDKKDKEGLKAAKDEFAKEMQAVEKASGISHAMANGDKMKTLAQKLYDLKGNLTPEAKADLEKYIGEAEISRGGEEAGKKLLPEGSFMVGNPVTGKTMVVKIKHGFGEGNKKGWTSMIAEAFDPEGGSHEDLTSWGGLGRALGIKGASNIQETLAQYSNTSEDKPFMKQIDDKEYQKLRSNTRLGLQETMAHKDFKLINESRNRKGEVTSRTYAQDMPDGTQNAVQVDAKGYITDPVMARLLKQKKPINNVNDLHEVMKGAVGNRAWVTAHFGSDIHVGDALGHHIQLEYDGKGAPRVIGGKYDGYRFMDANDIPKDAVDPATGEPIKALFKNGKLVDRRFSTRNEVPMKEGNAVMYDAGNGKYRKGRIHSIENGVYKITDGKHHVIGMFDKSELKPAMVEGKTNSDSGQAVVRLAKTGVHRMNTSEAFGENEKARDLFKQATAKAKIGGLFDDTGNLNEKIELNDKEMASLKKVLGRSKAGKAMLQGFNSAHTKDLQIHVPDALKAKIEAEGVTVGADGTAKISVGKFEQLRDVLGGMSIDHNAREYLEDHFNRKDRKPKTREELEANYQPKSMDDKTDFGRAYKSLFKPGGNVMSEGKGLYNTQLEAVAHMIERGRGIVGAGMGTGKTLAGVTAAMHYKATKLANGEKPKKTLVVSPSGIMSDWGKEIHNETNAKALYIGSEGKMKKKDSTGNYMKSKNERHMFGQDNTEQEAMSSKQFLKNMQSIGQEDHDFHIMSYDQFMKHRDALAKSGLYDNIIIDEVHAFKNQSGQRGKSLAETTDAFKNVWGLSGTPMENDAREVYSLIDTITGGRHELGTPKEFADNYLQKDKNGKIIGIKGDPSDPNSKAAKLGDILANIVQFRGSEDVTYNDGRKIKFPRIIGANEDTEDNIQHDFMGNMVDKSRDHQSTDYYGTKHSVFDYEPGSHTVTAKDGSQYEVQTTTPAHLDPKQQKFYDKYNEIQSKFLPEAKLKEMAQAAATGMDGAKVAGKGDKNYLTAMQKLQKYLNAGSNVEKMYVPGGASALEADFTGEQAAPAPGEKAPKAKAEGFKPYNPMTGEGHYIVDEDGHKRYFESDGQGSYARNKDGTPKLLPPLHHDNPKAQYLKQRISTYLDNLANENSRRKAQGKPELMPKIVVKSSYTTFGTDIANSVLKDLEKEHPHLHYWADKLKAKGMELGSGQFTGEAEDREQTKVGFRGNKKNYANEQGNIWATTVSPAGKEGVDFGNAHLMLMYDQDWNPQRMAQFTARVRRSDSAMYGHDQVGRDNSVRIESLHMPGTVEDFMFNAEDTKMGAIQKVTRATRDAEQAPKFGDSEAKAGIGKNFTRKKKKTTRAVGTYDVDPNKTKKPNTGGRPEAEQEAAATQKALKLVILVKGV